MRAVRALLLCGLACSTAPALAAPPRLTLDGVNAAVFAALPAQPSKRPSPVVLKAEVLLDRARFSPGAIDGVDGENFRKAVKAYQAAANLPASGELDKPTWDRLVGADAAPVLVSRPLTAADLKGPYVKHIPAGFEKQAALKRLGYADVEEKLSEQVHATIGLLRALNPKGGWKKAGSMLVVPQVVADRAAVKVARVVVDKPGHAVEGFTEDGKLAAFYPASIGSDEKPAPSGQFAIRRVIHNPDYTYNPKYAFKGVKSKKPFTIAPGPNNPVGSVWLDLSYEGYGIHGTPKPDLVGKTQSHGCIRLTNWDAEDLASMVAPGTPVMFQDTDQGAPAIGTPAGAAPNPPVTPPATAPARPAPAPTGPPAP